MDKTASVFCTDYFLKLTRNWCKMIHNLLLYAVIFLGMRPASCTHNFARGRKKISLGEPRGLIKFSNVRTFCFLKFTFIFGKRECASGV